MRITLVRTAYSSILYEGEDFSCVLMDGHAQIVAMSKGQDHPLHIVPIGWSMRAVREKFGGDIHPGDVFLHNDPYTGGTHLNDVAMLMPLFTPGDSGDDELFVFPVVRAHWGDVGGMSPGSLSGDATEIYQEGVRIPPIKVVERGRPNQAALELIFANMRGPRERIGDYRAMVGTCRKAAERIEALAARYGAATMRARGRPSCSTGPRRACARRSARCRTGRTRTRRTSKRPRAPRAAHRARPRRRRRRRHHRRSRRARRRRPRARPTSGPAMAPTGAFTIIKSFLDPGGDVNSGAFRPLTVISPQGTIVNARPPAPCGGHGRGQVLRGVGGDGRAGAGHRRQGHRRPQGRRQPRYLGGVDPRTGETFVFYEYPAGGTGAWDGGDGNNTVRAFTESDMTTLQPIEAVEQNYPLRVERTTLREDSGGDGRWRGGLGLSRELSASLGRRARFSVLSEKTILPPYGVCGGAAGAPNRFFVIRDGRAIEPSPLPGKVSGFLLSPGDVVVMDSSGGGGYGDPLARDPAAVAADVAEGYVSRAAAEAAYGVVMAGSGVDADATERRRADLRRAQTRVRLFAAPGFDTGPGRGVRLDADTAARLAVSAGAVVELVNPRGAPLRAWVQSVTPGDGRRAELAPDGLDLLAMSEGSEVEIRAVHSGTLGAATG